MDYRWCDICGNKCFYDSVLDIEALKEGVGASIVLCKECSKTYEIVVRRKKSGRIKFIVDDKIADWNGSYYIDWLYKKGNP